MASGWYIINSIWTTSTTLICSGISSTVVPFALAASVIFARMSSMLMKSKRVSENSLTISEEFSYLMMSLLEQTMEHLEVERVSRLELIYEHFKPVHVAFEGAVDQLHRDDGQDKLLAFCKK